MQRTTAAPASGMTARQALTIAVLACAQLMLVLDVTVVNVALPDIGTSLGLGRTALTWVMTIYTTLFGGLVLAGGKAADLLGARRTLVAGLAIFILASLLSALARDPAVLLLGRALQGIGAALLSPSALAVLLGTVSGPARGRALAVWGSLSAVGSAVGVSLGGVVTSALGWEWIFAINVPIGVAILAALPALTTKVAADSARPDVPGAALVTAGTALVVYGLVNAGNAGWVSGPTLGALAAGVVIWAVFAAVERRTARPMLRVSLLREPPVVAGTFLMVVATGLMVGNFFLGSFALQRAYGDGPLRVGLEFLPVAVGVGLGAHLAGRLLQRLPARVVATAGLALTAVGEGAAAVIDGSRVALVVGLSVAAFGIGAVFVTAFTSALASAGPDDGGLRSAIVSTAHEIGGAFGVAILSSLAAGALTAAHPGPAAFSATFGIAAIAAAAAALVAVILVPAGRRAAADHPH